jgi:hypothetical protein
MAHLVASRLKEAVEQLEFNINEIKIQVSLAVGLCSTEVNQKSDKLAFEEYCVHAAHALETSLRTPNRRVVRYDEIYEKITGEEQVSNVFPAHVLLGSTDSTQNPMDTFAEYFSNILEGNYGNIPMESLPSLIEPLQHFLDYAHASLHENVKASGDL